MFLHLDRTDKSALWQQIVAAVIDQIDRGLLHEGSLLTPSRILAAELGVSRSTVQIAYEELTARGYTESSGRGGTRVIARSNTPVDRTPPSTDDMPCNREYELIHTQLQDWFTANKGYPVQIDFRHQEPYVDAIFQSAWKRAATAALDLMTPEHWGYAPDHGMWETRLAVKQYLALARGISVEPEQILVTSGAQQSMDLIAQALLHRGDTVACEDPGFPGARLTLAYRGMNVVGIPVDDEGMVIEQLPNTARLVFVTPAHQRPTGVVMSVNRRRQLLDFAATHRTWVVEDDFDGEYRYHGGPLPSLFAESHAEVLYIMTLSKVLAPGIRLAVIVGAADAVARIAAVHSLTSRLVPAAPQMTLATFMNSGGFTKHVRRMRKLYRDRHRVMMDALTHYGLNSRFRIQGAETGLHVFLEADRNFDEQAAVHSAAHAGVGIYPLAPYRYSCERKGLLLGFASTPEASIVEGVRRLADIL